MKEIVAECRSCTPRPIPEWTRNGLIVRRDPLALNQRGADHHRKAGHDVRPIAKVERGEGQRDEK